MNFNRREFVGGLTLAGAAGLLGVGSDTARAEPPPETTRLRRIRTPATCVAPQFIAEELLQAEGFTDVQYIQRAGYPQARLMASGEFDIVVSFLPTQIVLVDMGAPVVILAGSNVGCDELLEVSHMRNIRDLKGKTVSV